MSTAEIRSHELRVLSAPARLALEEIIERGGEVEPAECPPEAITGELLAAGWLTRNDCNTPTGAVGVPWLAVIPLAFVGKGVRRRLRPNRAARFAFSRGMWRMER